MTRHSPNLLAYNGHKFARRFAAHQYIDIVITVIVFVVALVLLRDHGIGAQDSPSRRALYQTLAGLSATLFGLTMAIISVLVASIDKPIGGAPNGLPPSLVRGLTRPAFGLLRSLGFTVLASLALLVLDGPLSESAWVAQPVVLACLVTVVLRVTRVLLLLSNLLAARTPSATK